MSLLTGIMSPWLPEQLWKHRCAGGKVWRVLQIPKWSIWGGVAFLVTSVVYWACLATSNSLGWPVPLASFSWGPTDSFYTEIIDPNQALLRSRKKGWQTYENDCKHQQKALEIKTQQNPLILEKSCKRHRKSWAKHPVLMAIFNFCLGCLVSLLPVGICLLKKRGQILHSYS